MFLQTKNLFHLFLMNLPLLYQSKQRYLEPFSNIGMFLQVSSHLGKELSVSSESTDLIKIVGVLEEKQYLAKYS